MKFNVVRVIDSHCMKENPQKWKAVTKSQSDGVPTFLWSSAMYLAHSVIWYILQCIIQHWAVLLHLSTKFLSSFSFFENKNLAAIWDKSSLHLLLQTFSFMNNTDCQRWYQDEKSDSHVIFVKTLFYFFHPWFYMLRQTIFLPVWGVFPLLANVGDCSWN